MYALFVKSPPIPAGNLAKSIPPACNLTPVASISPYSNQKQSVRKRPTPHKQWQIARVLTPLLNPLASFLVGFFFFLNFSISILCRVCVQIVARNGETTTSLVIDGHRTVRGSAQEPAA